MAALIVVGVVCALGAFLVGIRYERQYLLAVVRRSHDRPVRGAAVAFAVQAVAAVVDIAVGGVAHATGNKAVGLAIIAPVLVAHGALVLAALPTSDISGYRRNRRDLVDVGASTSTARAIAWAGGAGAFLLGFVTIVGAWSLAASAGSHGPR